MFARNPKNNHKVLQRVAPADAAAGTVNGVAVDTTGYEAIMVEVRVDTIDADHTLTVNLQHGDDVAAAAVTADATAALAAASSNTNHVLSYVKQASGKQCRVQLVRAGSNSSQVGYTIWGCNPTEAPVS